MNTRTVVCLVGSSRFKAEHLYAAGQETLQGKIVLMMGLFGHLDGLDMEGPVKAMLDELHLDKIRMADEVLVVAPDGLVGLSTAREVIFAVRQGKRMFSTCNPLLVKNGVSREIEKEFYSTIHGLEFLVPSWLR